MVSFQAHHSSPSPNPNGSRKTITELDNSSKKRKWAEPQTEDFLEKTSSKSSDGSGGTAGIAPIFDIELHLDTPLPLEWQRCLDIQSGEIHFYNTRTQKRTSIDPRRSPEPPIPRHNHMSLDLELNLTCNNNTTRKDQANNNHTSKLHNSAAGNPMRPKTTALLGDFFMDSSKDHGTEGVPKPACPSWLAFERERDQQEMVATVCTKCHMLVMLCKSSPACPNCKFLHPPDQSPPELFKQRLSLLC